MIEKFLAIQFYRAAVPLRDGVLKEKFEMWYIDGSVSTEAEAAETFDHLAGAVAFAEQLRDAKMPEGKQLWEVPYEVILKMMVLGYRVPHTTPEGVAPAIELEFIEGMEIRILEYIIEDGIEKPPLVVWSDDFKWEATHNSEADDELSYSAEDDDEG